MQQGGSNPARPRIEEERIEKEEGTDKEEKKSKENTKKKIKNGS